ncbi:MAG: agmatinase [Candidatus Thermoplasmatota archaeon]|jgi:agmatinase|nr:agmatinase [Candidatus Thermoplasmatota archaeon]MCL5962854.1 agmatinase [Candidatus Thermoplasmatota archaeon]
MHELSLLKFADARKDYKDAKFVIIGIPFDVTASYRPGARFAPDAIRSASWNFESWLFDYDIDLSEHGISDLGNVGQEEDSLSMYSNVKDLFGDLLNDEKIPVTFGGDHSITIPIVDSFKDVSVIVIDAHLDFRNDFFGNKYSHASVSRRIADHIGANNMVVIGVRSICKDEFHDAAKLGLNYISSYDILNDENSLWGNEAFNRISTKRLYLSIDIDGMDPAFAPGTGTPEPFGLTPYIVKKIIKKIGKQIVGMDITEVSPPFDNGNTAALAARIARDGIASRISGK